MPKPGAFDKAKVKGSGGFGASKSGRFDGPKESCDYTPSASAYNAYVSIGEQLIKSAKKQAFVNGLKTNGGGKIAGFGSGSKRGSAINGMKSDAPGPGAYADGIKSHKSTFDSASKKRASKHSWGSGGQHKVGSEVPMDATPPPGTYGDPRRHETVGSVKKVTGKSSAFGHGKRFDEPAEVVQADYAVPGAFSTSSGGYGFSGSMKNNTGFGGTAPRMQPLSGMKSDAPGPGAYIGASSPGSFAAKLAGGNGGSSAWSASKSSQHASNPNENNVSPAPPPGAYDLLNTYDKHQKKSFHGSGLLGKSNLGGSFGSNVPRAVNTTPDKPTPGPGEYATGHGIFEPKDPDAKPSSVFASASKQREGVKKAIGDFHVPKGVGAGKASGKANMGFGGESRHLAPDEATEVAELRAMMAR